MQAIAGCARWSTATAAICIKNAKPSSAYGQGLLSVARRRNSSIRFARCIFIAASNWAALEIRASSDANSRGCRLNEPTRAIMDSNTATSTSDATITPYQPNIIITTGIQALGFFPIEISIT
jgi:hypothetical protein